MARRCRDLLAERMDMRAKANETIVVRSSTTTTDDPGFAAFVTDSVRAAAEADCGAGDCLA